MESNSTMKVRHNMAVMATGNRLVPDWVVGDNLRPHAIHLCSTASLGFAGERDKLQVHKVGVKLPGIKTEVKAVVGGCVSSC